MPRSLAIAAAQLGPIARDECRERAVARLLALLREAEGCGAELVVFPELALTTFFPRWYLELQAEIDAYFETEMPSPTTRPLFEAAAELGVAFYLGYAAPRRLVATHRRHEPNLGAGTPRRDRLVETLAAHVHRMSAGEQRLARLGRARNAVGDVDNDIPDDKDAHSTLRTSEPRHDRAASPRCPTPGLLPSS